MINAQVTGRRAMPAPEPAGTQTVFLSPAPPPNHYREAMAHAARIAAECLDEPMLIAWYDRDRDFEAPLHATESHGQGAVPGYVEYARSHGANLCVNVDGGRFVFYYICGHV